MTGAVLLVLFVAECLTLLNLGNLLTLHVFLGMLLLGPVCLKVGSTLWRFTRYYTGSAAYVRRGPPAPLRRVTGPFVILTTVAVLGSGIMLIVEGGGPSGWQWIQWHRMAFLVWAFVMVIHLASYVPKLPRMLSGRAGYARNLLAARATRWLLLCGSWPPAWGWRSPPITSRADGAARAASSRSTADQVDPGPAASAGSWLRHPAHCPP